jgi:hypothetical protein
MNKSLSGEDQKKIAIDMEYRLIKMIEKLRNNFGHYRKHDDGTEERGFYYYFIKNVIDLGYTLPGIKNNASFDDIICSKTVYRRLMKTLSAKFSRLSKGSIDAIEELEDYDNRQHLVYYSTLSSLSFLEIFVLTHDMSALEILELFRGKEFVKDFQKKIVSLDHENDFSSLQNNLEP